jgi:hypothetical protein
MRPGEIGMVLDRALTPELLGAALRVATDHDGALDARRLLTVALRDQVSAQEAQGKTKKCLSRVWVSPPAQAQEMIRWAIDRQAEAGDRRALHFGAILATFPFAGSVAAIVGRQLHLDAKVEPRQVKAEARAILGDRSTIDIGARKVLTTMRYLGLLRGPDGGPLLLGDQPEVSPIFAGWIMHALLLTRQVESVAVRESSSSLEFATLKIQGSARGYPLLEIHEEERGSVVVSKTKSEPLRLAGSALARSLPQQEQLWPMKTSQP